MAILTKQLAFSSRAQRSAVHKARPPLRTFMPQRRGFFLHPRDRKYAAARFAHIDSTIRIVPILFCVFCWLQAYVAASLALQ